MKLLLAVVVLLLAAQTVHADSFEEHDYILNCSGCHRLDGAGSSAVPSLHAMSELSGKHGARNYWIQVPGAAQAPISNARLAALMNWLMERFTGQPPKPPYTAKEVARLRSSPLRDPLATRKRLLENH